MICPFHNESEFQITTSLVTVCYASYDKRENERTCFLGMLDVNLLVLYFRFGKRLINTFLTL